MEIPNLIVEVVPDAEKSPIEPEECPVCLDSDESFYTTPCGHCFHLRCLERWQQRSNTCPVCRASLRVEPPQPIVVVRDREGFPYPMMCINILLCLLSSILMIYLFKLRS